MAWDRKAPYDVDGNLLHYPEPWRTKDHVWKPVVEFTALLTYKTYQRGRSAAYLMFETSEGQVFPMFMSDLDKVIPHLNRGQVYGVWTISKKGQNFGIRFVRDVSTVGCAGCGLTLAPHGPNCPAGDGS